MSRTNYSRLFFQFLLGAVLLSCLAGSAYAGTVYAANLPNGNIGITVDENCNGVINGFGGAFLLPCGFLPDPGPGGLSSVLTYDLFSPPGLVAGDVLMTDSPGGALSDVIRFNPNEDIPNGDVGALLFYSMGPPFDSLADTPTPPGAFYANFVTFPELNQGGVQYVLYTPTTGQPGFVADASAPVEYLFISDVPEPATLLLVSPALIGLAAAIRLKRKSARIS